nr:hypothetical protein [uncultured Mogibacterium sp.]
MEFIHDRKSNILFSLLYSRVKEIKYHNKTLTLKVDEIYEFVEGEEKSYPGEICFKKCDVAICDVLIFNKTLGKGRFNGKSICLQQFIDEYADSEFEIINEGYFGTTTTYTGWLWEDGKRPVSAIMYIWNSGDMVYRIEK